MVTLNHQDLKKKQKSAFTKGKYISIDHGIPLTPKGFLNLKLLVEQGKIKPVIDSIYPLEAWPKPAYVEKGHKGNV